MINKKKVVLLEDVCFDLNMFPITIIKFLLNKNKLRRMAKKTKNLNLFDKQKIFNYNDDNCADCQNSKNLCRRHESIKRIIECKKCSFDELYGFYFYKNEVFKVYDDKIFLAYLPHTKLISGPITERKIKKLLPISINNPFNSQEEFFKNKQIKKFSIENLKKNQLKCWFNFEFNIIIQINENEEWEYNLHLNE
jgi:hypothetical protein